jgi:hypothetical protein
MSAESNEDLGTLRSHIQTISLVLSIVRPQVIQSSANSYPTLGDENRRLRLLDRLSLFFVPRAAGDVAAVSANLTTNTVEILQMVKDGDEGAYPVFTSS